MGRSDVYRDDSIRLILCEPNRQQSYRRRDRDTLFYLDTFKHRVHGHDSGCELVLQCERIANAGAYHLNTEKPRHLYPLGAHWRSLLGLCWNIRRNGNYQRASGTNLMEVE